MANKRLKILLIGPAPPPMGGIVRYCRDILESELATNNDITFFDDIIPWNLRPSSTTKKFTWNIIKRDGVISTIKIFSFVIKKMYHLRKTLKRGGFDIVHIFSTAGYGFFRNTIHIKIAKRYNVKCIFHLLGQIDDLYCNSNPLLKKIISYCLNTADVHIVQSPGLAKFIQPATKRPVYSIFNGVSTEQLIAPDGHAHSRYKDDKIKIVTVGTLGHKKGTFDIIEVAQKTILKMPNLEFVFIGGGEVDRFRKLSKKKNILHRVKFFDKADDLFRTKILQTSDIFILPSYAEGQPIALLEAMAVGLPIISSIVGSIPEVVKEKNGFLIKPGDLNAIIKSIKILAKNKLLRQKMGKFNAQEAKKKYQLKRVIQEIQQIYNKL